MKTTIERLLHFKEVHREASGSVKAHIDKRKNMMHTPNPLKDDDEYDQALRGAPLPRLLPNLSI